MKIFTTSQVRLLDQYTIEHEPIRSIDLMERAAEKILYNSRYYCSDFAPVIIFAGPGNNGGDALALARMLLAEDFVVEVFLLSTGKLSADCEKNRKRLNKKYPGTVTELTNEFIAPEINKESTVIDGLFGSGLTRPLNGMYADAVTWINSLSNFVFSIDVPSGLLGEDNQFSENPVIVKAKTTLCLQFPKISFFFEESSPFLGKVVVLDIGIHPEAIEETPSDFNVLEKDDVKLILKDRPKFSHKGTFGHAFIIAGSIEMCGASVLAGKAALRAGAGLVTVHGPGANRFIVMGAIPEVIFQSDVNTNYITHIENIENYSSVGIGPGIGTSPETVEMLRETLSTLHKPCVIDADALNIISQHKELLQLIPKNSILTPHPKEFERLFGASYSSYERMLKVQQTAKEYGVIIILKGAHTIIATSEGKIYFNSTGNAGMATAGSGDVLTGILTGLLAQGYSPEDASKIGVLVHGLAGDQSLGSQSKESLIAGDIIEKIGSAYRSIRRKPEFE
ncbi:MAG: NAD(P)H-hydrate dehydratase [Paludibacter sp.]|nr:NAD(P)H-hydrate dehydratase [Paludibacter sp.]